MLPPPRMVRLFGILNVTRDSFSDGGRWLDPTAALRHADALLAGGADVVDVGAESTHPDAEDVPTELEIERLTPVVTSLLSRGVEVSVDTWKPAVMRAMAALGVQWINDVHGMRDPAAIAAVAAAPVRVVVMFARQPGPRADKRPASASGLLDELRAFFTSRIETLVAHGVDRQRIVLDPGMGFFLGDTPEPSLLVLRNLAALRELGQPLLVSVSRKSFLGAMTGRDVTARGAATLAAELWAVQHGAAFVRTHDPVALRDALVVLQALRAPVEEGA